MLPSIPSRQRKCLTIQSWVTWIVNHLKSGTVQHILSFNSPMIEPANILTTVKYPKFSSDSNTNNCLGSDKFMIWMPDWKPIHTSATQNVCMQTIHTSVPQTFYSLLKRWSIYIVGQGADLLGDITVLKQNRVEKFQQCWLTSWGGIFNATSFIPWSLHPIYQDVVEIVVS